MNNWKVIFATVVIFGAGVIIGALLVQHIQHSYPRMMRERWLQQSESRQQSTNNHSLRSQENPKNRPPELLSRQFLQQLDANLSLSLQQRESVQNVISNSQIQVRRIIQDSRMEIRGILTPEQVKNFDALMKRAPKRPASGTTSVGLPKENLSLPATNTP